MRRWWAEWEKRKSKKERERREEKEEEKKERKRRKGRKRRGENEREIEGMGWTCMEEKWSGLGLWAKEGKIKRRKEEK